MDRHIWFGTKDHARWIPAPAVSNYAAGAVGWTNKVSYLNGGANVRRSFGSHREYNMTWNLASQETLNPILDFAQGLYGTGLIYWVDPFAQNTNVLPKDWATPVLGATDGVNIANTAARPTTVPTSANSNGFPTQSAVFTGVPNGTNKRCYIPVPPDHDLIIRAYGSESGGTVRIIGAPTIGSTVQIPWSSVTSLNGTSFTRFSGDSVGGGVEFYINTGTPTATAIISGVMAQIVPEGETPVWTQFMSGQGNSGCRFDNMPQVSPYSAGLNKIGMTAQLTEVGAWL